MSRLQPSMDGTVVRHHKKHHDSKILSVDRAYAKQYKKLKSMSLLKEFTQSSTIHGVQHIFREGETPLHRVTWTIFFLTCLSGATYLIYDSWTGYVTVPIAVTVSDTNYPLDGIYFPAVSVCPTRKIVKAKAMEYLVKRLDNATFSDYRIQSFLKALSSLQHPLYHDMALYLNESRGILDRLEHVNTTDLMINALPLCNDIFLECYWQGRNRNCCLLFPLQRSEEGFCYSFNSITSERYKDCIYKDAKISKTDCTLLSTVNTGPRSGVEILLKATHKVVVQVHHPNEYPDAGMGSVIPIGDLDKLNIGVKPTITESSDEIRKLPTEVTGCYFKDSQDSAITKIYSQKSCLLECRMKYILQKCKCLPYYITMKHSTDTCNSTQLYCIVEHTEDLRFYRPPSDASKVSDDIKKKSLDCTRCLPTCNERQYEIVIDLTKDYTGRKRNYHAYIDVFYSSAGAVKYTRDMTYDYVQLLVNLGGIGGLFLGGSLLSLLEAVYWFSKAFITYLLPVKKGVAENKKVNSREIFTTNQGWLN